MNRSKLLKILCAIVLLAILLSGCKQTHQNLIGWNKVNLDNKVTLLLPIDIAANYRQIYEIEGLIINLFRKKGLTFSCAYVTDCCSSNSIFEYQLENLHYYTKVEKKVNGRKVIILKDKQGFYEYWKTKVIRKYFELDSLETTTAYFFDINNQKVKLRLYFEASDKYNCVVDSIINSTKVSD